MQPEEEVENSFSPQLLIIIKCYSNLGNDQPAGFGGNESLAKIFSLPNDADTMCPAPLPNECSLIQVKPPDCQHWPGSRVSSRNAVGDYETTNDRDSLPRGTKGEFQTED